MIDSQMNDMIKEKLALKQQIDSLEQNLSNQIKEKESLLQTFTVFKNEFKEKESKYIDKEIDLEKKIKELDNIVYKVDQFAQTVHIVISSQHVVIPVIDDEETLILEEAPMELPKKSESCNKCLDLEAEFVKRKNMVERDVYTELSNSFAKLEKHCISLELDIQLNQQIFQKDKSYNNQNALDIPEYFENNDLKAQLQAKDTTIRKLKEHIKSMRENDKEEKVTQEMDEIETINIELEHIYGNADLKGQIQEKVFMITSLKNDLRKLKGKKIVENAAQIPNATTIAPGMFKLDLDPLAPRLLKNRDAHIDYLKYTQEQADILQGIVEQAKAKQPLDNALDFACKHAKRFQELLVYVRDTCPNANKPSDKLVAVTPMKKVKKVRIEEFY
ncbi:hypothetical protein Tco_0854204 [Tanacetum coccineum]